MDREHHRLAETRAQQASAFYELANEFESLYNAVLPWHEQDGTTPIWRDFNRELERVLLPRPPINFLEDPTIMRTMVYAPKRRLLGLEVISVATSYANSNNLLLEEDYVGRPYLLRKPHLSSPNTLHHIFHLARFELATGKAIRNIDSFLEWGGGYGNLAKLVRRIAPASTYVIVDLPLIICLQWIYLATVFGRDEIRVVTDQNEPVVPGKINLLPIGLGLEMIAGIEPEMSISTFALHESPANTVQRVLGSGALGARNLLVALPPCDLVDALSHLAEIVVEPMGSFSRGGLYVFR